ncbi:Zinc finger protein [Musa troglodytarum]|uniref:Zinc finger protein n=1 Tax=Musa troglodytarum TaxID=320322 RepID=A0A9E7JWB5_9LILI|nr:Zinc finger protein [Musa troglodytarum]
MCGDVGFDDKLFRCRSRFQHSYCTNFYYEEPSETTGVCDWCLSERYELPHKKSAGRDAIQPAAGRRTAYTKRRTGSSAPASKPTGRRYKLLKDVLSSPSTIQLLLIRVLISTDASV